MWKINNKNKLTQEYLKELLTYDPDTGIFVWKERLSNHFKNERDKNAWNTRYANKICGGNRDDGYILVRINKSNYLAHRLAFLYVEGYLPENFVDHIDRNPANNKWDNLREVSKKCNAQNCKLFKNNTSGVNGVSFDNSTNKWRSHIVINKKQKSLGYFENFEDAVRARYQEEIDNPLWTCSINSSAMEYLNGLEGKI